MNDVKYMPAKLKHNIYLRGYYKTLRKTRTIGYQLDRIYQPAFRPKKTPKKLFGVKVGLKTFRRHIVELGDAGLVFIYDELEADTAVTWSYLLHTVENPMIIKSSNGMTHIQATTNAGGISDAYLFANDELKSNQTDQFFYPAVNWLRADDKGYFPPYKNHWHFTAISPYREVYRFATIVSTHGKDTNGITPERISANQWKAGDWIIKANLSIKGKATFVVENKTTGVKVTYDDSTKITESGKTILLKDQIPELEI